MNIEERKNDSIIIEKINVDVDEENIEFYDKHKEKDEKHDKDYTKQGDDDKHIWNGRNDNKELDIQELKDKIDTSLITERNKNMADKQLQNFQRVAKSRLDLIDLNTDDEKNEENNICILEVNNNDQIEEENDSNNIISVQEDIITEDGRELAKNNDIVNRNNKNKEGTLTEIVRRESKTYQKVVEDRKKYITYRMKYISTLINKEKKDTVTDKEIEKYFRTKISNFLTQTKSLIDNRPVEKTFVEKYYNYGYYSCLLNNLPNKRNDPLTFNSDHWFNRTEVEPLCVGDEISFYYHVKDTVILVIIKEIHIKKEETVSLNTN